MRSLVVIFLLSFSMFSIAEMEMPKGVVVSKNEAKQAITVRNLDTGKRHTYFLNERTNVRSQDIPLSFAQIQPGQAVGLYFTSTDIGRELNFLRIPKLDQRIELEAIDSEKDYFVSGVVLGIRPVKRTITIQGPRLTQRMTLHLPDSVVFSRDGTSVKLTAVKKGDVVELRYNESAQGFVIVSGELTKKAKPVKALK